MRIAHLANFYGPRSGGLRTSIHALGAGYLERGHEVLVIVPGESDTEEYTPFGRCVTVASPRVPFSGGYRVIVRKRHVRRLLEDFAPDVIEVSDRTTLRSFATWAKATGARSVFFSHERVDGVLRSFLPRILRFRGPIRRIADAHNGSTARMFDIVVSTTEFAREEFDRIGARTELVPLGVDGSRFKPAHYSAALRDHLAPHGEALVVMASRLSAEKRPDLAIDAVRLLSEQGTSISLVCAGAGPLEATLRRRARGAPVSFLGFVTDREYFCALLATADVVIAPGPIETFGLAALEALASGTPAVVNAASALPSVVAEAGVAAAGSPESFAAGIRSVLDRDEDARRSLARRRAETLPWSATVSALLTLYGPPRGPRSLTRTTQGKSE